MTGDSQCREVIRMAKRWKADAIIGRWKDSELKQLECLNIPIVLQNYHHRTTLYSSITGDYIQQFRQNSLLLQSVAALPWQ